MDIPVPAVVVEKDLWQVHIAYSKERSAAEMKDGGKPYRVRFAGPINVGDTSSVEGVFRILYVLKAIVQWGFDVYEPEYLQKILVKYRRK